MRPDLNHNTHDFQLFWVELDKIDTKTDTNIIIRSIYRRPGLDITIFNQIMSDILSKFATEKKEVIHMGDYNLDLLKVDTHLPTNNFIDLNFAHTFIPLINKPTRVTPTSATIIDNIYTNKPHCTFTNGIIISDISDHFPIVYIKHTTASPEKKKPTKSVK
jgi:hypothetical protein